MILIKGEWCKIRNLDDAIKLIREEFNYGLADRIEELVHAERLDYEFEISDLEDENEELIGEIRDLEDEIRTLESEREW